MSKLKTIVIYLLSVIIAFESGVMLSGITVLWALNTPKKVDRNRVSYQKFSEH